MMDRRGFLLLTLSALAAWELEGCGGGGGNTTSGLQNTRGVVKLPPGTALSPTTLSVTNVYKASAIAADGSFQLQTDRGTPVLALLADSSGRGIMCGFVDPQSTANVLDARAQAVALLHFVAGGYTLPPDRKRDLLSLIAADPSVDPLAAVIAARIAADPHALENGDAQIGAALRSAFASLSGGKAAIVGGSSSRASVPASHAPVISKSAKPLGRDVNVPLQLLVQPSVEQSGIEVLQDSSNAAVVVTNHFRRRCQVRVYATGTEDASGKRTDFPSAQLQGNPVDLGPTTALSIFSTLSNLFSGQTAFVPVSTPFIGLTMANGATKTFFDVVVLGSSSNDKGDPAYFSDPKYAQEVAAWRAARRSLNIKSLLVDLTLGVITEALGILFVTPSDAAIQTAIDDLEKIDDPIVTSLLAKVAGGDAFELAQWKEFYGEWIGLLAKDDLPSRKARAALYEMLTLAEKQAALETAEVLPKRALALTLRLLTSAVNIAGLIVGAGDIGAVIHDLSTADEADLWNATLFKPTLLLSPTTATITPGARQSFTVKVPLGLQGTVVYDWSTAATFAILSDNATHTGKTIETSSATVDLVTTPSDQGTISVAVTAFLVGPQGGRQKIGDATATVKLTDIATQTAGSVILKHVFPNGTYELFSFVTFTPSAALAPTQYYILTFANGASTDLAQSVYLNGAPVLDPSQDPTQWVGYGNGRFYNLGGGLVGYSFQDSGQHNPNIAPFEAEQRKALQDGLDLNSPATVSIFTP